MIRRRTFWFCLTAWGTGSLPYRPGCNLAGSWHKSVLAGRTARGVWGEWWS